MEKTNRKRIAITGGRGRLAPRLAAHLRGIGHDVVLFSRTSDGEFLDVSSLELAGGLEGFDAVLHLAWSTVPLLAEESPGIEERQDFPFARALIAAASQNAPSPKLVFFSTAAVYGDTGSHAATEETPCLPLGRYAAGKLAGEKLFLSYANACVLRITNVFGAGCPLTRPQGIIPVLLQAARDGSEVAIWGDGSAEKDYLAANDLHQAVAAVLEADLRGVFNVSSAHSLSVNELVLLVEKASKLAIRRRFVAPYPWDVNVAHVSSDKLRNATGWRPRLTPREAVQAILS